MFDLRQMMMDAEHRSKVIETFWLFWAFVLIGFDNGLLGPCLPDLQNSVGATLEQMSYIFFVQGTGALLGNVFGYLLERRFDRRLLLGLYLLTGSIVNILIPLVPNYFYLLSLFLVQGATKGLADFGAMSLCNVMWEENKALPFQFIVVGASFSTFVSPFLAQPFIDDSLVSMPTSVKSAISTESCLGKHFSSNNKTQLMSTYEEVEEKLLSNVTDLLLPAASDVDSSNSDIRWPFVIVGCVTLPAAVAFVYFYFTKPGCNEEFSLSMELSIPKVSEETDLQTALLDNCTTKKEKTMRTKPGRTVLIFRTLIVLLNVPVFGLLLTFADLLTTIGMSSPMCMTAVEASYFSTVLWGAAMIGRAVSALILICVPMFLQLLLCSLALVVTGAVLAISSSGNVLALWFGTAGVGLFATPSMPGFIVWSGDYAPITPFFMNLSLCAAGVGEMVLPFVGGQLMAALGTGALMIFAVLIMVAMLVLFLLSYCVARRIDKC